MTEDVPGNNSGAALSDFNVQVRIERTTIRDAKTGPPDEEASAERGLYTPSKSEWDRSHGSDV